MSDAYPVELTAPDISVYRSGNTGLDYVTTFDSGKPGPHVMVSAVTHGNELCGAITLDFLFCQEIRPKQGKLTFAKVSLPCFGLISWQNKKSRVIAPQSSLP